MAGIERQSSDFVLGDGGRQESVLEPGFVRAPRDMKPPTPVEWGRGDSLMWETAADKSTPLAGYGRDRDPFADAVASMSPSQPAPPSSGFGPATTAPPPAAATTKAPDHGATFAAILRGERSAGPAKDDHAPQPAAAGDSAGSMTVSAGPAPGPAPVGHPGQPVDVPRQPSAVAFREDPAMLTRQRTSEADLAAQFRTQSQVLTDELHHQCKTFPPPPPTHAPGEQRRHRAARWYYFATKWDITHEQPPPPRSPLPLMDRESENPTLRNDGPLYPYRGDYWLSRCNHWFSHIQSTFPYPFSRTEITHINPAAVQAHAYLGD